MTFGEEMKRWREANDLTQDGAADYLDVNIRTLQEWEQDRAAPGTLGPIRKLMAAFPKPKKRA